MFEIKRMAKTDIEFAVGLTNIENWANVRTDFDRLVKLNPDGNFVAWMDGVRIGIITSVKFDNMAFVGNLIIVENFRGKGYGRRLMEHALAHLRSSNISTIELDGDFPAVELYRKLGFKDKYLSLRFERQPEQIESIKIAEPDILNLPGIIRIDKRLTGISRSQFLAEFMELYRNDIYSLNNSSYSIVRKCYGNKFVMGPTIAETEEMAEKLINSILNDYRMETIYAGVPEINRNAVKIMQKNNFCYNNPSLRMYSGDRIDYEENIYTIISGDVG